jgi:diaminohydroxyphosphoribosylaminopyrimidine deaminase/5-amino-6-(5-phosphoribosylamino)uracil reductase
MRLFSDVSSSVDDPFFSRALSLAEKGRGATAPNPLVGCVVVRHGVIVGEGFHAQAGGPHAEVFALRDAGAHAADSDVYVTLEPCSHHGKTPPCTDALIAAGVSRVFVGMRDPNPLAGGGSEALDTHGIEVVFASDPGPFIELNAGWLKRMATGLPLLTVKLGTSMDGHTSLRSGRRATITGPSGAIVTQRLRSTADAVLVGAATVTADDPALTVRDAQGAPAPTQPLRVVLVREHVPPTSARVFTDGKARTLVVASEATPESFFRALPPSVEVARFSADQGLVGALRLLGDRGIADVLIESGPQLFTALWRESLIDELVAVTAGGMAGMNAPPLFVDDGSGSADALVREMVPVNAGIVGDVSVIVWESATRGLDPAE